MEKCNENLLTPSKPGPGYCLTSGTTRTPRLRAGRHHSRAADAAGGRHAHARCLDLGEFESLPRRWRSSLRLGAAVSGGANLASIRPGRSAQGRGAAPLVHGVTPLLKSYYGTVGDLNVRRGARGDRPSRKATACGHPQKASVRRDISCHDSERIPKVGRLRTGVARSSRTGATRRDATPSLVDLITVWSCPTSLRHYYRLYGGLGRGQRVVRPGLVQRPARPRLLPAQAGSKSSPSRSKGASRTPAA